MRPNTIAVVFLIASLTACGGESRRSPTDTTRPSGTNTPPVHGDEVPSQQLPADKMPPNGGTSTTNEELANRVRQAISGDQAGAPPSDEIQVTAANGVVTLRGTVRSQADKDAAATKARAVRGVQSVVNSLMVKN